MATIDPKKVKIAEMLNIEFPKEIGKKLSKEIINISEQEKEDFNYLSRRTTGQVYQAVSEYYRCTEQQAERMVGEILEEGNRSIKMTMNMAREQYEQSTNYIASSTIRTPVEKHLDRTFNEGIAPQESFDGMKKDINGKSQNNLYLEDVRNGVDNPTRNKIEDIVFTEMFAALKRKLNVYESRQGEETFYEVKRILGNKFVAEVVDLYNNGSKQITEITEQVITNEVHEVEREYLSIIKKEENINKDSQEKTEKNDFEKELKGNMVTLEDSFENYMASEEELKKHEKKKSIREELLEKLK